MSKFGNCLIRLGYGPKNGFTGNMEVGKRPAMEMATKNVVMAMEQVEMSMLNTLIMGGDKAATQMGGGKAGEV